MKLATIVKSATLAGIIATTLATSAAAQNRWVTIVNRTGYTIMEFYSTNVNANSWGGDVLGNRVISHGGQIDINFDDGSGQCLFDFRAIFNDGDVLEASSVNVCEIGTYTYN